MLVFWWTGRGFLVLLILFVVGMLATMAADIVRLPAETSWFAAIVFLLAAPVNWIVGRHQNELRRKSLGPRSWRGQLIYDARHKFLSLPMESWSVAMLAIGVALGIRAAMGG